MSNKPVDDIRKQIRNGILAAKADRKALTIFGQEIELVQPPLMAILQVQRSDDTGQAMAETVIKYVYVPGTDQRVFDDADVDAILRLPFGPDMQRLQNAISDLTGIEAEVIEQGKNFVNNLAS